MRKAIPILLSASMLLSLVPTAIAVNQDYTAGTRVEYVGEGSESYTITVPALLAPGGSGNVTLSGTWAENRQVTVTADENVVLKNSIRETDTKTLRVSFAGISEKGNNSEAQTFTQPVSVEGITNAIFGTWSGKFNYNVEMVDAETDTIRFGEKYFVVQDNVDDVDNMVGQYVIFYADGSMYASLFDVTKPAGFATYNGSVITTADMSTGEKFIVSLGGDYITEYGSTGTIKTVFRAENVQEAVISTSEAYVRVSPADAADEIPMWIEFYDTGRAMATVRTIDDHHNWDYTFENNEIKYDAQPDDIKIILSSDSKTLTITKDGAEIATYKVASSINSPIKFNTRYVETYDRDGGIEDGMYYIFYPDNSVAVATKETGEHMVFMFPSNKTFFTETEIFDTLDSAGVRWEISADGETVTYYKNGEIEAIYEAEDAAIPGIAYDVPYTMAINLLTDNPKDVISMVARRDGSVDVLVNNIVADSMPVGTVVNYGNKLLFDGEAVVVINNGNCICMYENGSLANVLVNQEYIEERNQNSETMLRIGERYIVTDSPDSGEIGKYMIFNLDGTIDTDISLPISGFIYTEDSIVLGVGEALESETRFGIISNEGKTVLFLGEVTCVLESELN